MWERGIKKKKTEKENEVICGGIDRQQGDIDQAVERDGEVARLFVWRRLAPVAPAARACHHATSVWQR